MPATPHLLAPADLSALLASPAAAALAPARRQALAEAAGDAPLPLAEPPAVLADTLDALATLGADGDMLLAAVLHAVPALRDRLGADRVPPAVQDLLEGQAAAGQVWALHAGQRAEGNAEGLRRLLLALVRDLRGVPLLLGRQLARLRHADGLPAERQRALAQLTRDIHAPLANRLGIWQLKWELEDRAFRLLEPGTYQRIARLLDERRDERDAYVAQAVSRLREALAAQGVKAEVAGRAKHIYSIWKKMQRKGVPIGELYDLRALRVIVGDVPACYAALGVVHALWTPIPSEFDDYIARPKRNDYQSLHTAVVGPEGRTLEVQVRTREMHEQAELGVAAHWKYKEGRGGGRAADAAMEKRIAWMRRLLEQPVDADVSLLGELRQELVEDRIYVLTPRGEVIDLPRGATPLDFAYHVHTEVGHRCRGAKVDGRIVPLDHRLRSGDRVEILTAKAAEPRRDWLVEANGFLASARSREKVRNWFHRLDRARNVQAGRELLEKELRRAGLARADLVPVCARFNVATDEDLQVLVALGDVGPNQVVRALQEQQRADAPAAPAAPTPPVAPRRPRRRPAATSASAAFRIEGVDNLLVQVARCCQPLPGDGVAGYLTTGRGVSVHRDDCATYARLAERQPDRCLPVAWRDAGGSHEVDVQLLAQDRKWLLREVTNTIAQANVHVGAIQGGDAGRHGRVRLRMRLRVDDADQLAALLDRLADVPGVEEARRA